MTGAGTGDGDGGRARAGESGLHVLCVDARSVAVQPTPLGRGLVVDDGDVNDDVDDVQYSRR